MIKKYLTHQEVYSRAMEVATQVAALQVMYDRPLRMCAVPRGGVPALYAVVAALQHRRLPVTPVTVQNKFEADVIIDDVIDSGATRKRYASPAHHFFALVDKTQEPGIGWIVFPWEHTEEASAEDIFTRLLQFVGEDPLRGGLLETPKRCTRAWQHWTSGYVQEAPDILKQFEDGGEHYDEMVHVRNIPFYSHCEHHLAPFFGVATFAYIPDKKIVGLSKMNRLVDMFARRLQVQERLTRQILDSFVEYVKPLGAGCVLRARHLCMESRGVQQQGCETTTAAFHGVVRTDPAARAEFFSLLR